MPENAGRPCPVCGAREAEAYLPGTIPAGRPVTAERVRCTNPYIAQYGAVVRCRSCDARYADPVPETATLAEAYAAVEDPTYLAAEAGRRRTFARSLARLRALRPHGDLLDVGCYAGTFLGLAREAGYRVTGVELSRWATAVAHARLGGDVVRGGVPDLPFGPARFDVVTCWDVLEHLEAPREALAAIHRVLRPGGLLALSTHLLDSVAARLLGRRYPFLQEMHLVHFTRLALRGILEAAGFRLLGIAGHTRYVSARYLAGRLGALVPGLSGVGGAVASEAFLVPVRGLGLIEAYARRDP